MLEEALKEQVEATEELQQNLDNQLKLLKGALYCTRRVQNSIIKTQLHTHSRLQRDKRYLLRLIMRQLSYGFPIEEVLESVAYNENRSTEEVWDTWRREKKRMTALILFARHYMTHVLKKHGLTNSQIAKFLHVRERRVQQYAEDIPPDVQETIDYLFFNGAKKRHWKSNIIVRPPINYEEISKRAPLTLSRSVW